MKGIKSRFAASIFIFLAFALLHTSCLKMPHTMPVMQDRTTGWEPHVIYNEDYYLLKDENAPLFNSFLFAKSKITAKNPYYVNIEDDSAVIMEDALKEAFGSEFINIGSTEPIIVQRKLCTLRLYVGGETCVIIDTADGRVIQCIDTRIQEQFQKTTIKELAEGFASIDTKMIELTDKQVRELEKCSRGFSENDIPKYFAEEQECPLDVSGAFEVSSRILYKVYPSGRWEYIGDGEYVIYDASASDSWLIIGDEFMLMLDKNTGEKKFFSVHRDGFLDQSVGR